VCAVLARSPEDGGRAAGIVAEPASDWPDPSDNKIGATMADQNLLPGLQDGLCNGCGQCVTLCPEGALVMVDLRPQIPPEATCSYCGVCEEACPSGAIALSYEITFA
jgi:ferredoxin